MLIASSFLAGSLLTLLVPVATFIAVATWLTLVVRRSEARSGPRPASEEAAREERAPDGAPARRGE